MMSSVHESFADSSLLLHACCCFLQGGCIIRAGFLDRIKQAYQRDPNLPSLLVDPPFAKVRLLLFFSAELYCLILVCACVWCCLNPLRWQRLPLLLVDPPFAKVRTNSQTCAA
jgi:hypothetical protein